MRNEFIDNFKAASASVMKIFKSDVCKWSGEEALFVCQWLVPVRVVGPQSVGFIGWLEFKGRIIHCIELVCDSGCLVSLLVEQMAACKQGERFAKY